MPLTDTPMDIVRFNYFEDYAGPLLFDGEMYAYRRNTEPRLTEASSDHTFTCFKILANGDIDFSQKYKIKKRELSWNCLVCFLEDSTDEAKERQKEQNLRNLLDSLRNEGHCV